MGKEKGKGALPRRSSNRPTSIVPPSPTLSTGTKKENKRVSSACQRCKQKKTKCDGQIPCERCVNDDVVCEAGKSRTSALKHVTPQYAEMLETNLHASNEAIKKLYEIIEEAGIWNLGQPQLKPSGAPSVHGIASKLGCVRNPDYTSWPQEIDEFASQRARTYHSDEHEHEHEHSDPSASASSNAASSPAYSGFHDSPRSTQSSVPTTPAQRFGVLDTAMDFKQEPYSGFQDTPQLPHTSTTTTPVRLSKLNTSMNFGMAYSGFQNSPQSSQHGLPTTSSQPFETSNSGMSYGQQGSSYGQYRQDAYASSTRWTPEPTYMSAVSSMNFSFNTVSPSMDSGFCNPSEIFRQTASY